MALVSQAEWARRQGISREAVRKQIQSGRLQLVNGKVDENQAKQEQISNIKTYSTRELFLKAKLENELERGKLLKLETAEKEQSLISADKVKDTLFRKGRAIREAFMNLPDRVASVLEMKDARTIHITLTKEIRAILEELTSGG